MQPAERYSSGPSGKKNAPSFIYEILTGKPKSLRGRDDSHEQKPWGGISVDRHIPTRALDDLNRIEEIEMRASCEGSGPERPTFLIFRFRSSVDSAQVDRFRRAMNSIDDVRCGAEIGNQGFYRVGVTAPLWYAKNQDGFEKWWLALPTRIRVALAVIKVLGNADH